MTSHSPTQTAAIANYKTLLRDLFVPSERNELQAILQQFIQDRSLRRLSEALPLVLNTALKRTIGPSLTLLLPQQYQEQFVDLLNTMPPHSLSPSDTNVAQLLERHRQELLYENVQPKTYENWGVLPAPSVNEVVQHEYENFKFHQAVPNTEPWYETLDTRGKTTLAPMQADEYEILDTRKPPQSAIARPSPPILSTSPKAALIPKPSSPTLNDAPPLPRKLTTLPGGAKPVSVSQATPEPWLSEAYMAGNINRTEADQLLRVNGMTEGLFLVREKPGNTLSSKSYVLSMVQKGQSLHLLLESVNSQPYTVNGDAFGKCYSPEALVELMRNLGPSFQYQLRRPLCTDDG